MNFYKPWIIILFQGTFENLEYKYFSSSIWINSTTENKSIVFDTVSQFWR